MANYSFTSDILKDVLFRASEPTDGSSDFAAAALAYLNRAYRALWQGGAELDPTIHEEWWWLRKDPPGVLTLNPVVNAGTVAVTNNSTTITFSTALSASMATRYFKVDDHGDVFRISSHTGGSATATLDAVYTGPTSSGKAYRVMQLDYSLATDVLRVLAPMRTYRDTAGVARPYEIQGMDLMALEAAWPLVLVESGLPDAFAFVVESKVRVNRYGGLTSTELIRVEYDYLFVPADLANTVGEQPVVPLHWRYVLADFGTMFLLMDKDDSRAEGIGLLAKAGLKAMATDNQHKLRAFGRNYGQIRPREPTATRRGPIRTTSGHILG